MTVLEEFLGALAFAGDLTMGQPPEHSPATACLAARIAEADGAGDEVISRAAQLAMIRWGGCTANAVGFADLFGDDVKGRRELLAGRNPFVGKAPPRPSLVDRLSTLLPFFPKPAQDSAFYGKVTPLVFSHCEVVGEIARRAGFSAELVDAIDSLFEFHDGSGWPKGRTGREYDRCIQYVWLASDIEAYCRFHGTDEAGRMVLERGGKVYDASLAQIAVSNFQEWLDELQDRDLLQQALQACKLGPDSSAFSIADAVILLSDFADLKRPQYTGLSRAAGNHVVEIATRVGLSDEEIEPLRQGVLLCTLGFVSVNSATLARGTPPSVEAVRLVPYWTERILSRAPGLAPESVIASQVFERLDGSGWHKGMKDVEINLPARIAQVAFAAAEIEIAGTFAEAAFHLNAEAKAGRLDPMIVATLLKQRGVRQRPETADWGSEYKITQREREVLGHLIQGKSNKEIARIMSISPKTVGRHLENSFRKLDVTTRAAAAIKALRSGLVPQEP